MTRLRLIGTCVLATIAFAALAATNAAALPEWGECVGVNATGHYSNSNCTTIAARHAGAFEWTTTLTNPEVFFEGPSGVFSAEYVTCVPSEEVRAQSCRSGETTRTETLTVECPGGTMRGEIEPTKKVKKMRMSFFGCEALKTIPCSNTATPGEIEFNVLKGELGYINRVNKQVGLLFEPESASAKKRLVTFQCGPLSFVVGEGTTREGVAYPPKGGGDGMIATLTPVNEMAFNHVTTATVNSFENVPSNFENKPLTVLESYAFNTSQPRLTSKWSKAGFALTSLFADVANAIEIKA